MGRKKLGRRPIASAKLLCTAALVLERGATGFVAEPDGPGAAPLLWDQATLDINSWSMETTNYGIFAFDIAGRTAGGFFPKDPSSQLVFGAGLQFGTLFDGIPAVTQSDYDSEFQPGRILDWGLPPNQLTADDPGLSAYRVYLCEDSVNCGWAGQIGAPMLGDEPWILSDLDAWSVCNDLDTTLSSDSGQRTLGLEIHQWAQCWTGPTPLNDVVFVRFRFNNHSSADHLDSYAAAWFDPDVTDAGDDLVGWNKSLSLGHTYNSDENAVNTAFGALVVQGPLVSAPGFTTIERGAVKFNRPADYFPEPGDTVIPDTRVLQASSFSFYINGTDPDTDEERWNTIRGLTREGAQRPAGPFDFTGDPHSGSGVNDGDPNDKRFTIAVGPFDLRAGKSQELVVACIGGHVEGELDPLAALAQLESTAVSVREFYPMYDAIPVGVAGDAPTPGARVILAQNSPNPFNPHTAIEFEVGSSPSATRLCIYDLAGHLVKTLVDAVVAPGRHQVRWEGLDAAGSPVSSGVYICRLETSRAVETRKMLLLK